MAAVRFVGEADIEFKGGNSFIRWFGYIFGIAPSITLPFALFVGFIPASRSSSPFSDPVLPVRHPVSESPRNRLLPLLINCSALLSSSFAKIYRS